MKYIKVFIAAVVLAFTFGSVGAKAVAAPVKPAFLQERPHHRYYRRHHYYRHRYYRHHRDVHVRVHLPPPPPPPPRP